MFTSIKARLALVLSIAWVPIVWLSWTWSEWAWSDGEFYGLLVGGWASIWPAVYAGFWVFESDGVRLPSVKVPTIPRWLGFVLIGLMVFLIMGLPKAIF